MRLRSLALASLCLLAGATPASAAPRGLDTGFFDYTFSSAFYYTATDAQRASWLDDARASGAGIVRIHMRWAAIAPARPAAAADPNDPAYRWATVDAAVRDAQARGLRVMLSMHDAPRWAEGPERPGRAFQGSWMPNISAFSSFIEAAGRRYPSVTRWQIWNEPNLDIYISPQWKRVNGRTVSFAAGHYRRMLNGAYSALKRVNRRNVVVSAGLAPYGDPPGGTRTRPVTFWMRVLSRVTRFDVLAHNPYSVANPGRHALSARDVSVPDLGRLTRLVRAAVRSGRALPRKRKPLWITEISWDSNPPDPNGVPLSRHARWLADSFYVFWKQGASVVLWFQVRDQEEGGGLDQTVQSGIFTRSGTPKPAQKAFAFPVACERKGRRLRVWGKAPAPGPVTILRGTKAVGSLTAGPKRVFLTTISGGTGVQAKAGNQTSLKCVP